MGIMTLVLLMVFSFGANGLNTDPIWTDELYAISNMGGWNPPSSPAEIVSSVADNFPDHVPLFFLLGAGWAHFVGWTQFALRLMPVLSGVLMIAWMYRLGSDMFNRHSGKVAAILLGTSAYMILYIHDFRMYSLFLMCATMHLWSYWRLAHGRAITRQSYAIFVVTALALFYTHVFSFILFAGLGLYHVLLAKKSRPWLRIISGWCIAGVLFLPYLPVVINGVRYAAEKGDVASRAATVPQLISTFLWLFGNGSWLVVAVFALILVYAMMKRRLSALIKFMLMPVAMVFAIIGLNEFVGIIPLTRMRYFLIVWIPMIIIAACGLSKLPHRRELSVSVLLIWCVAGSEFYRSNDIVQHVGSMDQTRLYPPMQDYVYHLAGKVSSEDYLLGFTDDDHVNKDLTLGKSVGDYYTQLHLGIDGGFIRQGAFGEWLDRVIRQRIDRHPYLLFTYNPQDLATNHNRVLEAIRSEYLACDILVNKPDLFIQRYVKALLNCERGYQPIEYDNGVTIVDRFARYSPEKNIVQILTGWEVDDERLLQEYNVSFQIINPDWQLMAQDDQHLYNNILKWYQTELSTAALPPGDYSVVVIVYDRLTSKKVSGTDLVSDRSEVIFPILAFTVEA